MKRLLLIALLCLPIVSAQAASNAVTRSRIKHIRELVARQKTELNDTKVKLNLSLNEIGKAEDQIRAIAAERDQWQKYGEDQHERLKTAETTIARGKAAIYWRDLVIVGLIALISIYAFLKFYMRVPFI